jgi:HAD superfamily hydrolase (TIGR01450 family)
MGVTWLLDLDGVVWRGDQPIPGSADAVARLRASGRRVVVVTNNSSLTVAQYMEKLDRMGVSTDPADLVTSAQVSATLVQPGERVFVCAGDGVREAVTQRGATIVAHQTADVVIVGWTRAFDYDLLTAAMHTVRGGARLIGTNEDPTYPAPDGVIPGGGSLVAAVAYASGVEATFAGKPHPPTVAAVHERYGPIDIMVGDQPRTDGALARALGARFGLVLSGITGRADLPVTPQPDLVADDLASLVAADCKL